MQLSRCLIAISKVLDYLQGHLFYFHGAAHEGNLWCQSRKCWASMYYCIILRAMTVSFSVAEHAFPAWCRSGQASKLDPALNSACRAITGCLKSANVEILYCLCGIVLRISEDLWHPNSRIGRRKPIPDTGEDIASNFRRVDSSNNW